jgi:hypothetical protein
VWVYTIKDMNTTQIPVNQQILIENPDFVFHLGVLNNLGASSEYGFFSDISSLELGNDVETCVGDILILDAGAGKNSYSWTNNLTGQILGTEQTLEITQSGKYKVIVTTGDCTLEDSVKVVFNPLPTIQSIDIPDLYCIDAGMVTLKATPTPTSTDFFEINGQKVATFLPKTVGLGEHTVTYTYTDPITNCDNTKTKTFNIVPLPEYAVVLEEKYCINAPNVPLSITPAPVSANYYVNRNPTPVTVLNMSQTGAGEHELIYQYTDANGCSNQDTTIFIIEPLPELEILGLPPLKPFCINANPILLMATPEGGTFRINATEVTHIIPSTLGAGIKEVFYTYTDPITNCTNTTSQTFEIANLPSVGIAGDLDGLKNAYCVNDNPFALAGLGSPTGGVFYINGLEKQVFNPMDLGVDTHTLVYQYEDANNCTNSVSTQIIIHPLPEPEILDLQTDYCIDVTPTLLKGSPSGGTFSIEGNTATEFNPATLGEGEKEVIYTYQNPTTQCFNYDTLLVQIHPLPTPYIIPLNDNTLRICSLSGDTLLVYGGNWKTYQWSTGSKERVAKIIKSGDYQLLTTNEYDCENSISFTVVEECYPDFVIPNAFSPNLDGINDTFEVFGQHFNQFEITIFNRWGEIVFKSTKNCKKF